MTVLAKEQILKEIETGRIRITPFNPGQVGPASIDLHLGEEFRVFKKVRAPLEITEAVRSEDVTRAIKVKDRIIIRPGELVHGITLERIKLPPDICGRLEGRSRFARLGLLVHITAGMVHPGVDNRQVLEITNMAPFPLVLKPGTRICQIVLERTEGKSEYAGIFRDQVAP